MGNGSDNTDARRKICQEHTVYENPLKAGEMQIIKVKLNDEGGVVTENPEVGVSVELDWKPGGDFDIEI